MNIFKRILEQEEVPGSEEADMELEMITKSDILELIDMMSPEDIDDLGNFILDFLSTNDDGTEFELEPEIVDDTETEELDSDDMTERKYFDKKKIQLKKDKMVDKSARRDKARKLKRLYKANKTKIKRKSVIYRKKVKRNPMRVKIHRQ